MPNSTTIYYCQDVLKVRRLHEEILNNTYATIHEQLDALSDSLYSAVKHRRDGFHVEFSNCHPDYLGFSEEQVGKAFLTLDDCKLTISRECGFEDWNEVEEIGSKAFDCEFEMGRELLLNGKIRELGDLLLQCPYLIHQHSDYGHHAGLIHYVAANGVELWNQYMPSNIVDITKLLLRFGADIQMRSNIYRGAYTLKELIYTSSHPWNTGVGESLIEIITA